MKTILRNALLLSCAASIPVAQSGCSLFVPRNQAVSIQSSESTGQIIVDGKPEGTGSASLMLDRTKSHTVLVKTPDGRSGATTIEKHISTTGILDIVGGCIFLVPFLGILGPGFTKLDPDHVAVVVSYLEQQPSVDRKSI